MTNETFLSALKATAKIACCASIFTSVSCQTQQKKIPQPPGIDEPTPEATETKNSPPPVRLPPRMEQISPQSEAFLQCNETITSYFAKQDPKSISPANEEIPKDVVECCDLQANIVPDMRAEWSNRNECCNIFNWMGPAACTPWGPPTPPKFHSV